MDRSSRRTKALWTAVALGTAALLAAAWATVNQAWPWSNALPDRSCWNSIDRSLLSDAARRGDTSWEVAEGEDRWGDAECTVTTGDWRFSTTVMKTPLKAHLWWRLGIVPLGHGLPGMIRPSGDRVEGWLYLPPCGNALVNVNVPGTASERRGAADFAAKSLLTVGNAKIARCGGKPFPDPGTFDWSGMESVRLAPGESPCGVELPATVRKKNGDLAQIGVFGEGPVARCAALREGDDEHDLGLFSAVVLYDEAILNALSPDGVRTTVRVSPGKPLDLTREDLRYDRDAATRLVCGDGGAARFVHVFASGSDAEYAAIKRAVLNKVANDMGCH
ncbi:hypothetical protein IMZ11_01990 [Microtetraspora sp. AC03309]|uniref:hypothetical protein n=1 Tax=Microtetraspora sp. AC03309 TaxID=2779376 RepID=UPI001E512302|nr:hypothetical protein [Microtetraspora sp. AC03309]MCC5574410.1 hypothetical protein [Microtetraspora sp. AC03309]